MRRRGRGSIWFGGVAGERSRRCAVRSRRPRSCRINGAVNREPAVKLIAGSSPIRDLPVFETVDLAKLREELRPGDLGIEAGQQDLPPLEADNDPHEHSIAEAIDGFLTRAHASVSGHLEQAHKHFVEIHDTDWRSDINRAEREAIARFNEVEGTRRSDLHHRRVEVDKRVKDLAKFRAENRLSRSPDYPDSGWSVFWVGVVVLLFVFESIANSAFLAKGNELGLVGAYTVAFGVSIANLVPPFLFFGPVSRNFVHRKAWRRAIAFACAVFYVAYAFILTWASLTTAKFQGN